ncbi:thiol peroxidase (atypical 2-Cys peroxiredoxin) [Dethiosulfatibacter aminovorans DSM 17477]|uniref:Thiol peroxidase (Atypical 2-Cys peroxiredoxin) n=1 Tax=Dethiosulfatibacter aminovorans DSM 17477 TaxID=1121476 RepID=A0A1M6I161_9FIRM|nr:thiol peroxidase [Dethiosulfatibacter aminovorans]SHJ28191.1 thiol peroxidase (atypical 2-Cys peroxiredoxin) [Dethiosulfatibacter aminovorans DSM 17477]
MDREFAIFGGKKVAVTGDTVRIGDKAPNFRAVNNDLSVFDFYNDTSRKIKIISASPSLDTGTCSLQAAYFNEKAKELSGDVEIITVTVDLPFAQKRFCGANDINNIRTVSDHRHLEFGDRFGLVLEGLRLLTRAVIIIDEDNIIRYVQHVYEVADEPDYDDVLEALKEIVEQ